MVGHSSWPLAISLTPWPPHRVPLFTNPSPSAQIFHLDCDPLKSKMAFHAYPAQLRAKTDSAIAVEQLFDYASSIMLPQEEIEARRRNLISTHKSLMDDLRSLEAPAANEPDHLSAPLIVSTFRRLTRAQQLKTRTANESISNYPHVWNHLLPRAGEVMTSGASSLGWALGAAIGFQMAGEAHPELQADLQAVFVGDGSFVFGVPSASYWISRRYDCPFLTVVFNNGVRSSHPSLSRATS